MTITQEQYDAYVEAEDNYYLRRFTTREYATYTAVQNLLRSALNEIEKDKQVENMGRLISFYSRLASNDTIPDYRIYLRSLVNSIDSSTAFASLTSYIPSSSISAEVKSDILDLISSIEDHSSFVPPEGSPANFYQTFIDQRRATSNPSTPSSPTTTPISNTSTTTPVEDRPPATSNCYEKNGVVMTIGDQSFYLKLLPAIQSNIPMQGSSEAPNTTPGLHIKIIPNLARLRIPGFAPVYQHLGIDSALITLVGTFVPEDGTDAESFTNVTGFTPPANINDQAAFDQIRNSELERSSYLAATKFYDFAVKTGGEVSVRINVPEAVGLDNNPFVLNRRPGFKGIIKSMDLFHKNLYRTWYTIQFEVSDFGMYSTTPLDMNQDINSAIQERVQVEDQARVQESQETLSGAIEGRDLISYNSNDPGYFKSGDSYYYRFANPQTCRRVSFRGLLNLFTALRCDDERWVRISGINDQQASSFATNLDPTELPEEAKIEYSSYEEVRNIRRDNYQQFNIDGSQVRQRDNSDVTGAEAASIAVQGGICFKTAPAAAGAVSATAGAAATGVGAPVAAAFTPATGALVVGAAASCTSFAVSIISAAIEYAFNLPDENEGTFEGVVLPIALDAAVAGVGAAITPALKNAPVIGPFISRIFSSADEVVSPPTAPLALPPARSPASGSGVVDPTPPLDPLPVPDPTSPPTSNTPVSGPRPSAVSVDPSPTPAAPDSFIAPPSPAVSAATRSISSDSIAVRINGINKKLDKVISEENISELYLAGSDTPIKIENGDLVGDVESIITNIENPLSILVLNIDNGRYVLNFVP